MIVRIDTGKHHLRVLEAVTPHVEGAKGKIAVACSVPTPVDVILAVEIAVKDKGVTACSGVIARVQDGASRQQFRLQQLVPFFIGVIPLCLFLGTGIIAKGLHARQLLIDVGTAAIRTVVHVHRLPAIAHQRRYGFGLGIGIGRCNIFVEHFVPLHLPARQRGHKEMVSARAVSR